ncbi:DMT family transporter [Pigmentiphaga aceris]|uniref:DMT family transporter n=1 Tax=Pigmentiphaga aceris TaxID=1940612 RepID=A0A5C0AWR0_9BURK|nr:DMT family transporter [Pigmentiphaga aceris]QEI06615.1 DMT family transporter [Pigmentiphaga aceris]
MTQSTSISKACSYPGDPSHDDHDTRTSAVCSASARSTACVEARTVSHACSASSPPAAPKRLALAAVPLIVLEAALVIAWSSGFIGARFSIDHAPIFLVAFWRCVVVALLLLPWVAAELQRTRPAVLLRHAGIGVLAIAGYLAGIGKSIEYGVSAGLTALIADLLPIGTAVLATLVLGQRLGLRTWLGLFVGLAGVLLVTKDALAWSDAPLWAYSLPLLGMLSLALATLWQKRTEAGGVLGLLPNLCLQCAVSALVFAVVAGMEGSLLPVASTGFAVSVLWTALLPMLGGYALYWICLQRSSPTRVASVLYLSPAVTLLWAWAMFDEPLSWLMLVGTVVSGAGIWLVTRAARR